MGNKKYSDDKSKAKRKQENIYGTFFGDIEGLNLENIENKEQYEYPSKLNFVKARHSEQIKEKNFKIEDLNLKEESEDEIMEEYLKDYSRDIEKKLKKKNEKEEKNLEKTLNKKYGKGFQMLKKAGFKVGSGLGKDEQGMTDPIKIIKRKKQLGISEEDKKHEQEESEMNKVYETKDDYFLGMKKTIKEKQKEEKKGEIDKFEQFIEKWSKIKHSLQNENLSSHIDLENYINGFERKTENESEIKVIHFSDYNHSLGHNEEESLNNLEFERNKNLSISHLTVSDDPEEVKSSLIQLIKLTKNKCINHLKSLNKVECSSLYLQLDAEKIEEEIINIEMKRNKKSQLIKDIETITNYEQEMTKFNLNTYISKFYQLSENYKKDFYEEVKSMMFYCLIKTLNRMKLLYSFEDYLKSHKVILEILAHIKNLISYNFDTKLEDEFAFSDHIFSKNYFPSEEDNKISFSDKIFANFLNEIVINDLVNFIINQWNVKEYEKLLEIFQIYSEIIPPFMKEYIFTSALVPRLNDYVKNNFDKNTHLWILPWLEVMKVSMLDSVLNTVYSVIEKIILKCDIASPDTIDMLKPWRKVFLEDHINLSSLIEKFIHPKLNYMMSKFIITPDNQDISCIKVLFRWKESLLVEVDQVSTLLKVYFFPKWLEAIDLWLKRNPNLSEDVFNEIQIWYQGWKGLFHKQQLIDVDEVQIHFKQGLMLIINYANSNY
jgi:tuftelin-interacting protein 11